METRLWEAQLVEAVTFGGDGVGVAPPGPSRHLPHPAVPQLQWDPDGPQPGPRSRDPVPSGPRAYAVGSVPRRMLRPE